MRKNKRYFSPKYNVLIVGLAVKRTDKRSKNHLFSDQSSQTIKQLNAFWCFRRMTVKGMQTQ